MTNLYQASNQWAFRPAHERFWTLSEAHEAASVHRSNCAEARSVPCMKAPVASHNGEQQVGGRHGCS
jgi:hypothetical protein